MKKMLILVAIISLIMAGSLFANDADVLIDFSKLAADERVAPEGAEPLDREGNDVPDQNSRTMMDYSGGRFGNTYTQEQKDLMKTSLAITNWEVILNSSARTVNNMVLSRTREATSEQFGTVMGVRIRFPTEGFNASATIRPPFEIPAFEMPGEDDDFGENEDGVKFTRFEDGHGILKNVGTIKSIAVNVYGLNFPYGLSTLIIDGNGNERSMFMGYLNFDGWGQLVWENPAYIREVRNRDLRLFPLYPESSPFIKFNGFEIRRDAAQRGGDFIAYFKDVQVIYDKAVLDTNRDIDDEEVWGIIGEREADRSRREMERFGQDQVLRFLESQRLADPNTRFTPNSDSNGDE